MCAHSKSGMFVPHQGQQADTEPGWLLTMTRGSLLSLFHCSLNDSVGGGGGMPCTPVNQDCQLPTSTSLSLPVPVCPH